MSNVALINKPVSKVSIKGCNRLDIILRVMIDEFKSNSGASQSVVDNCLWELLTIPKAELKSFVDTNWCTYHNNLPASFLYLIQERVSSIWVDFFLNYYYCNYLF